MIGYEHGSHINAPVVQVIDMYIYDTSILYSFIIHRLIYFKCLFSLN